MSKKYTRYYSSVHDQLHPPLARALKFQIRYVHPTSLNCHQLYIAIVANGCGYTQGLFWLLWRISLVGQENQIEATQNLPDVRFLDMRFLDVRLDVRFLDVRFLNVRFLNVRFLFLSLLPMPPLKREYNAVSAIAR